MPLEFSALTAASLESLSRQKTVFFIPVGPLEDHGSHLPLALDLLEARTLCRKAGERLESEMSGWTAVILPGFPFGIEANTAQLALTVRAYVLRDALVDVARSLTRLGFRHFVCFSGHLGPKQLTAIEEAGKIVSRGRGVQVLGSLMGPFRPASANLPTFVSACSALITKELVKASPFRARPKEHGGARDTSVALALDGVKVDPSYANLPEQVHEYSLFGGRASGYWGTPSQASAAQGAQLLDGVIKEVFPKLRAVWDGANPQYLFRSWYSILPPNKSFFKANMLAMLAMLFLIGWFYLMFETLFPKG